MAVRRVSTLESFLFIGVVGMCLRKVAKPSLTSFTRFRSLSFRRRIEACSLFRHCGVRQRVRCLDALGLELGELHSLLGDEDRGEAGGPTGEVTGESNGEPSDEEGDGVGELNSDKSSRLRGKAISSKLKYNSMRVLQGSDKLTVAWRSHSLSLENGLDSSRSTLHKCVQILYYMRRVAEPIKQFVLSLRDFTPGCWAELVWGRGYEDIYHNDTFGKLTALNSLWLFLCLKSSYERVGLS